MIKTSMRRITDFYGGSGTHDWIACAALALLLLVALGGCNDKKQGSSPPPKVNTPELNQRTTKEPPAAPTISIPVVQQRYSLVLGSWSSGLTERQLLLELSSMSESTAIVHLYSPLDTIANGFLRVVGNMVEDAFAEDERQTCNLALKTAAYRFLASESAKELLRSYPGVRLVRVIAFRTDFKSIEETRDMYGNLVSPSRLLKTRVRIGCFEAAKEQIEKVNSQFFADVGWPEECGNIMQNARALIQMGNLSDDLYTKVHRLMYTSYTKQLNFLVRSCQ